MGFGEAAWDGLVSDLYLSALDPGAGARLPARLTALTGGTIASVWELRPKDCSVVGQVHSNVPDEAISVYKAHYYQHDPWYPAVQAARFGAVLQGGDIIEHAALSRSIFYNEFAAEHGMFHMVGAIVPLRGGTVGAVTVLRPREVGEFDADALRTIDRLLPHLNGTFDLRSQAAERAEIAERAAVDAVLGGLALPALVVDGHGALMHANALATAIPLVRTALCRRVNPHRLFPVPPAAHDAWARLVAAAARGQAGGSCHLPGEPGFLLTIAPLPLPLAAASGAAGGRVLVILRPLGAARGRPDLAAFGLTAAEAAATEALAAGSTPAEIAEARGVKITTIRTLLARAQDKMDARNLRDLVRLVLAQA